MGRCVSVCFWGSGGVGVLKGKKTGIGVRLSCLVDYFSAALLWYILDSQNK